MPGSSGSAMGLTRLVRVRGEMVPQVLVAELVDGPDLAQHEAPFVGIGEEGWEISGESASQG
ncbi:hypothetical protein GCM10010372_51530 [Streptomyces tauricus]|nr:hypothetical protein GCM10010372_51530 [Streptomyces tauricus]